MVEKNMKKEAAKKYRVVFTGRLCTVTHKSIKHPQRWEIKKATRNMAAMY